MSAIWVANTCSVNYRVLHLEPRVMQIVKISAGYSVKYRSRRSLFMPPPRQIGRRRNNTLDLSARSSVIPNL